MKSIFRISDLRTRRRLRRGFTLIEILVVVAIIIILLGAVIAVGSNIRVASMTRATEATLQALVSAAKEYRTQTNKEPGGGTGYFNDLRHNPLSLKILNRLPPSAWGSNAILDAWGNAITYVASSATSPDGYFTSVGADGFPNNTDDIRSTEAIR